MNEAYLEYLSLKEFYNRLRNEGVESYYNYCRTLNGKRYNLDKIRNKISFLERCLFKDYEYSD